MIIIDDDESKAVKKFIKYSDSFESLIVEFKEKELNIELIIGDDVTILEVRDNDSHLLHRDRIKLSELKRNES